MHLFNTIMFATLAVLMGYMLTFTTPDSASPARQVLFLLVMMSIAMSVIALIAHFTERKNA